MKLRYLIVLLLFFGNIVIAMIEQQSRDIADNMLMPRRHRLLSRFNKLAAVVMFVLLAVMMYSVYF